LNIIFQSCRIPWVLLLLTVCGIISAALTSQATAQTTCEATQSGMSVDANDNTTAFKNTLSTCAGKTIHIPRGTYKFSPHGYDNGFSIPDNTNILGDGSEGESQTVLQIADTGSFASFLWVRDRSNVSIHAVRFEGSSYDSGCARHLDYGHAITLYSGAGAAAGVESIKITNNVFRNFNGQSWVSLNAADRSPGIGQHSEIQVRDNTFVSDRQLVGGCAGSGKINFSVFMLSVHGSNDSGQGLVANVSIAANKFRADYVEGAVAVWSGATHISIQQNFISNAGLRLPTTPGVELGRYAVAVYNSAHDKPGLWPESISIVGNTIENPVSCGIYVASAKDIDISRNKISGQTDAFDVTLPKGAIALNHALNVRRLEGNELSNNHIGLTVVSGDVQVGANQITPARQGIRTKIYRSDRSAPEIQR
jgi:hypothetical protein